MTREIVSTSKQDWATPQWLFDVLHEEHAYDVDLFAAWYNAKLPRFLGPGSQEGENAFATPWTGLRGFANPPYAIIEDCLSHAIRQCVEGAFSTWLIPANTDTIWFHTYAKHGQIDLFKGRISFEDVTPPEIEAARLWALIQRKGEKGVIKNILKDVRKLAEVLRELGDDWLVGLSKDDPLYEAVRSVDAHCPSWREEEIKDRKKPGPGFPSMLVHFDPNAPIGEKPFRTRDAKTGRLL